jgi:hypothetical protein
MSRNKQYKLYEARCMTVSTGRKHVVREDYGRYFVVPLYEVGYENVRHDAGYAGMGILVQESYEAKTQ